MHFTKFDTFKSLQALYTNIFCKYQNKFTNYVLLLRLMNCCYIRLLVFIGGFIINYFSLLSWQYCNVNWNVCRFFCIETLIVLKKWKTKFVDLWNRFVFLTTKIEMMIYIYTGIFVHCVKAALTFKMIYE